MAYRFGAPSYFGAPMQQKHVKPTILGHMPYASYVCQTAGASIIGGGVRRELPKCIITIWSRRLQARSGRQKSWKWC